MRRSARIRPPIRYDGDAQTSVYPDGPPSGGLEVVLARLNLEAFPAAEYARVDDLLVYSLFATKSHPNSYRAWIPVRASLVEPPPALEPVVGKAICKACLGLIWGDGQWEGQDPLGIAQVIQYGYPHLLSPTDIPILSQ